ncbi:MAG TPA: carbohydrate ABC transporter permease [Chloroflexota bacterium]|nr:carbohydrate ABC transporter permease [Chloroflexota bacterium]
MITRSSAQRRVEAATRTRSRIKWRRLPAQVLTYTVLIVGSLVMLMPLFWMASSSLKSNYDVFTFPPVWIPQPPQWANYPAALTFLPFFDFFKNTMFIAVSTTIGSLLSNTLVAYAFARLEAKGREVLFYLALSTLMLPYAVVMIPQFVIFSKLGWVNTFAPLVVPSFFGNPFYIFLLRQFFLGIPRELEDAAALDGAGVLQTIFRVILPVSVPALVTVVIFQIQMTWNDFLGPLLYLSKESLFTVSLGLQYFLGEDGGAWHWLMAVSTVAIVPVMLMFFFAQRLFIRGIVMTGLKG